MDGWRDGDLGLGIFAWWYCFVTEIIKECKMSPANDGELLDGTSRISLAICGDEDRRCCWMMSLNIVVVRHATQCPNPKPRWFYQMTECTHDAGRTTNSRKETKSIILEREKVEGTDGIGRPQVWYRELDEEREYSLIHRSPGRIAGRTIQKHPTISMTDKKRRLVTLGV